MFLNAILIGLHLAASLTLILFILLHAGRGGGLSDMFGGVAGSSLAGSTVVEKNLDRLTVVVALVFTFTTVLLVDAPRLTPRSSRAPLSAAFAGNFRTGRGEILVPWHKSLSLGRCMTRQMLEADVCSSDSGPVEQLGPAISTPEAPSSRDGEVS